MSLRAGWARREITPPVGVDMGGYWGRPGPSTAVHDALHASVLLFEDEAQRRVALVCLDLVGLDADRADVLRASVGRAAGCEVEAVMIACSHTHSGPLSLRFRGMGEMPVAYLDGLDPVLAEAASSAAAQLRTAELSSLTAPVDLAINRRAARDDRDPRQLVPRDAHALRVRTDAGIALLVHYACHPVVLGSANRQLSADYPGDAMARLESTTDIDVAMFVNGACGDLNPPRGHGTFDDVAEAGQTLAAAVSAALPDAPQLAANDVAWHVERIELPLMEPPSTLRAAANVSLDGLKLAIKSALGSHDLSKRRVPEARLTWARDLLTLPADAPRVQPFAVQALRIGDLRLVGLEGEIFARYQIDLEREESAAWLCGYANGCVGYIPTADEYARGGYEIDDAYKVYPSVLMVAPASEAILRDAVASALTQVAA